MAEMYKSPRRVAEEVRQYTYSRFEKYMQMADDGVLPRALAIIAFSEELESNIWAGEVVA